jgi:hypothetical protein
MANEKEEKTISVAKNPKPKAGIVDLYKKVEVTTTAKAPFHKAGEKISVSPVLAAKMKANGWAE